MPKRSDAPHDVVDQHRYHFPGDRRQHAVSPDGQRLLLAKSASSARIVIVTNWTQELNRLVPTGRR